jgi:hypothetical protein
MKYGEEGGDHQVGERVVDRKKTSLISGKEDVTYGKKD